MGIQRDESRCDAMILPVVLLLMRTSASVKQPERVRERERGSWRGGGCWRGENCETTQIRQMCRKDVKRLKYSKWFKMVVEVWVGSKTHFTQTVDSYF